MFALSHLYYPWGFVVQGIALLHFVKRRPEGYWFYVIFFGGFLGAAVYIAAEMAPDLGLARNVFQGFGRRSRIKALEIQIIDNPSPGNYEEVGDLLLEQKEFAKAREAYSRAIAARADSPHTFYSRAKCWLGLEKYAEAIPDLEHVALKDAKFDYYRAAGLLADAYAKTGELERAGDMFADVVQYSTTPETLYNYANYLKASGQREESRDWAERLIAKKRTLPRYMKRVERAWFRKGNALLKELRLAGGRAASGG